MKTMLFLAVLAGVLLAFFAFMFLPTIRQKAERLRMRFYLWNLRSLAQLSSANMAFPASVKARQTDRPGSVTSELQKNFNLLCTQFEALCTKLDADAGVTDVNYNSTIAVNVRRVAGLDGKDPDGTAVA